MKENYRLTSLINVDAKSLTEYWQTESINILKELYTMGKWDLFQENKIG